MGKLNGINDDHNNGYLAAAVINKIKYCITMVCSGTHQSSTPVFLWFLRRRSRLQTYGEKTKTVRLHSDAPGRFKEELR